MQPLEINASQSLCGGDPLSASSTADRKGTATERMEHIKQDWNGTEGLKKKVSGTCNTPQLPS